MNQKTCVITGANGGIGQAICHGLIREGYTVYAACRTSEKAEQTVLQLQQDHPKANIYPIMLDLCSFESVVSAASTIEKSLTSLDLLINNAGTHIGRKDALNKIRQQQYPDFLTNDGFEVGFQANYLGHYLLVRKLLPLMMNKTKSRIIHVISSDYKSAPGVDWKAAMQATQSNSGHTEYCMSKLALGQMSGYIAKHFAKNGVSSNLVSPGRTSTNMWKVLPGIVRFFLGFSMHSAEEGAKPILYCATSDQMDDVTGNIYSYHKDQQNNIVKETATPPLENSDLQNTLWYKSEEAVKYFL